MTRSAAPIWRWVLALMFVPLIGCMNYVEDEPDPDPLPPLEEACPSAASGASGPTFVGNQQCGTVAIDEDGVGGADVQNDQCVTPQSYNAPGTVASASLPAPADASTSFGITQTGSTSVISCQHDLGVALVGGSSQCSGTFRRSITVDPPVPPSSTIHEFFVVARSFTSGPGASDTFSSTVTIDCVGESPIAVPTDGTRTDASITSNASSIPGTCYVDAEITASSTAAAGLTVHGLSIHIGNCSSPDFCTYDSQCPKGYECVLSSCRAPGEGASCRVQSQCSTPEAPVCSTSFLCQAGRPGDTCGVDRECAVAGAFCGGSSCRGAACTSDGDCAAGTFCTGRGCSNRGALGDPCVEGKDCSIDLRCLYDGVEQYVCSPGAPLGTACFSEQECAVGLRCLSDGVSAYACALGAAEGETCPGNDDACQVGLRCLYDPGTGYQCGPGAAVGEPCSSEYDCQIGRKCIDSLCAPPRGEGEACPTYSECADELYCSFDNTCQYF